MRPTTIQNIGALSVFDHDALDHVGDVLAPIAGVFEEVERFLPLDDRERIALLFEQLADGLVVHAVGFVLQPVDLDRVGHQALVLLMAPTARRT